MRQRLLLAALLALAPRAGAQILSGGELFPVSPAVNDQRGFAIAMDGEWLAIGARLEDRGDLGKNAGAVHLFHFEAALGTWKEKATVVSDNPREKGQFGFAVALRGNHLAVGEPGAGAGGEGAGAVHVFFFQGTQWIREKSLPAPAGETRFGSSVAIEGGWLAVGAGDPHGEAPGSVRLYSETGAGVWTESSLLAGSPGERFGHAVSLRAGVLAVGAPGADGSKGAVYVFQEAAGGAWEPSAPFKDPNGADGDQLGFAVATNGVDVAAGAPTAGDGNSGAVWVFRLGDAGLGAPLARGEPDDQLGRSVAIGANRIAAGSPLRGFGAVRVFTRANGIWSDAGYLEPESAAPLDLAGLSVAVSGEWVMFGTVLGDQGGGAAGSVASFRCRPGQDCKPKGEVAVVGETAREAFGISVAADGDLFAVGARKQEAKEGSVTLFRRSGRGWHQEERLLCPEERDNEFGAALALHRDTDDGDLLVVGEPYGKGVEGEQPGPLFSGAVYLFRREGEAWQLEAKLLPPKSLPGDGFGRSVATDGEAVVVGTRKDAAYVFQREGGGTWSPGLALIAPIHAGAEYGAAVAVDGDTIVVGAPRAFLHGRIYVFTSTSPGEWGTPFELLNVSAQEGFGSAVAYDGETLAIGAPLHDAVILEPVPTATATPNADPPPPPAGSDAGAVYLYQRSGSSWSPVLSLPEDLDDLQQLQETNLAFGSAVALRGADLVVGAPVVGWVPVDIDQIFLFRRTGAEWKLVTSVDAIPRIPNKDGIDRAPVNDSFGSGVAIGEDFFVVTSPGSGGGDRILLLELDPDRGKETP